MLDSVTASTGGSGGSQINTAFHAIPTVDTVNPTVDITDDQDGTASDGENCVPYTLTFSEPVQSVTAGDLISLREEARTASVLLQQQRRLP